MIEEGKKIYGTQTKNKWIECGTKEKWMENFEVFKKYEV
jgi:NDP-sugar pyrophosphorylase family protein